MQPFPQGSSSDYFGGTGIPNWLEDETLYSLVSRFHHLSGNPAAHITSTQLFGGSKIGYQHDLPCGLEEFSRNTGGSHGAARSIIREHTILPFYLPFRTKHDADDAYSIMSSQSIGSLKYRLGILTSRFRANHPLKACTKCMIEDRENNYVAYWHLTHQYPGVWLCPKHDELLSISAVKSTGVSRFQWILPQGDFLESVNKKAVLENRNTKSLLKKLAKAAISLARLPDDFNFDAQKLLRVYHARLTQYGFVTEGGSLRLNDIASSYLKSISLPTSISEFSELPTSADEVKQQVGKLLRTPRSGTHPLRHLFLVIWLYKDWPSFWNAYHAWENNHSPAKKNPKTNDSVIHDINGDKKNSLINLIREQNYAVTRAAREIGIDPTTAIAWAAQLGIETPHRPKTLTPTLRNNLIKDLKNGKNKSTLANKYGVSTPTVSRVLRAEFGLQQKWLDARFNNRLKKERNTWGHLIQTHGKSGIKALRMIMPATYAWLYRNDRAWFDDINQTILKIKHGNHPNVDWDSRDIALSENLSQLALDFSNQNTSPPITLGKICQLLPELKPKLERLHRLPLTYKALRNILGNKFRRNHTQDLF